MNNTENIIEKCPVCGSPVLPVWFLEEEWDYKNNMPTGRKRKAVDYLECTGCGRKKVVNADYLAGPWF